METQTVLGLATDSTVHGVAVPAVALAAAAKCEQMEMG